MRPDPLTEAVEAARVALDPGTAGIDATVAAFRCARLVPVLAGELVKLRAEAFVAGREGGYNEPGDGGEGEGLGATAEPVAGPWAGYMSNSSKAHEPQ